MAVCPRTRLNCCSGSRSGSPRRVDVSSAARPIRDPVARRAPFVAAICAVGCPLVRIGRPVRFRTMVGLSGRQRSRTAPHDRNGASNGTSREQRFQGPAVRRLPPASTAPLTNPSGSPKPVLRCARWTGSPRLATALSRSRLGHLLAGARRSSNQRDVLAHSPRCKAPASESGGRSHCSYRPKGGLPIEACDGPSMAEIHRCPARSTQFCFVANGAVLTRLLF